MRRAVFAALLALLVMGQTCEPTEPQPEPDSYCWGTDGFFNELGAEVRGMWNTIIGGEPAEDRRATVFVEIIGVGSCSGTVLSPHTVLTAGHCNGPNGYRVYFDPIEAPALHWTATGSAIHPGYWRWSSERGEPHADLMLLYFEDSELPGPYPVGFYDSKFAKLCDELIASGWGQTERDEAPPPDGYEPTPCPDGKWKCLMESDYQVLQETDTSLRTAQKTWGGICFGDSGGPLYAQLTGQPGFQLAGVTSTTASLACIHGSNHVKVAAFKDWIIENVK